MEPDDAWAIARKSKARNGTWDLAAAATALVQGALDRNSGDNVSVLCVLLKKPRSGATAVRAAGPSAAAGAARAGPKQVKVTLGSGGSLQSVALGSDSST